MLHSKDIASLCKIVILIDQTYIQSHRTGLAMITVNAFPARILWCKISYYGIVQCFHTLIFIIKQHIQFRNTPDSRQHT